MWNHFHGGYHWEFRPLADRNLVLEVIAVFDDGQTNLFVEIINPSPWQRIVWWLRRASYRTPMPHDALLPASTGFHIPLDGKTLEKLAEGLKKGTLDCRFAHIKGYRHEQGLFWFHGFDNPNDDTLCCSAHVTDEQILSLEQGLGAKAEKVFGKLKPDWEMRQDLARILKAMENHAEPSPAEPRSAAPPPIPLSEECKRRLAAVFDEDSREAAEKILREKCGAGLPLFSSLKPDCYDRVRFAVLKLSRGNLEELERSCGLAQEDWRDALMAAGFGHDAHAHLQWDPSAERN